MLKEHSIHLYTNKIKGYDEELYSYHIQNLHNLIPKENIECKGNIESIELKEYESNLSFKKSRSILRDFVSDNPITEKNNLEIIALKNIKHIEHIEDKNFEIKEMKLVELDRLRIVKDVHINGAPFNVELTRKKKQELISYLEKNDGVYPKEEAILVWKDRDPKDRRRVIYNVEDGYRRYVMSGELGLNKVYVNIIDDTK